MDSQDAAYLVFIGELWYVYWENFQKSVVANYPLLILEITFAIKYSTIWTKAIKSDAI